MTAPSVTVLLVSGYAFLLLAIAWLFDRMGERSAKKAAQWRTGNFIYHEGKDAWQCHQDQWLYPASFDPDKRVIRYVGQHEICGRCPVKDECSPSPGPREITRAVDPWPHSDSGRFHRGISLVVAVVAVFMPAAMLIGDHHPSEVIVLVSTVGVGLVVALSLGMELRRMPSNFPKSVPHEVPSRDGVAPATVWSRRSGSPATRGALTAGGARATGGAAPIRGALATGGAFATPLTSGAAETPAVSAADPAPDVETIIGRYATRWASDRRRVAEPEPTTKD